MPAPRTVSSRSQLDRSLLSGTRQGVHRTLPGHQGDVTALKFAHFGEGSGNKDSATFVSGDANGSARVWREKGGEWEPLAVLPGHSGSVASVDALELKEDGGLLVLTGGSDSKVHVWRVSAAGEAELVQKVDLKGKIPLELALCYLPSSSSLVLAIGGTETRIQLYSSPSASQPNFRKALSLDGHTDWVRALSFVAPIPASAAPAPSTSSAPSSYDISPGELLLASGSQDNYIRLWRFSRLSTSSSSSLAAAPSATGLDALDELEKTLAEAEAGEEELRVKAHDFTVEGGGETFSCASEAVLLGHDAWVTGLNWAPLPSSSSSSTPELRLLSTSADRSLILWTPIPSDTPLSSAAASSSTSYSKTSPHASAFVWTSTRRFGEFTSPTNLGFFGALWGQNGKSVMASGWGGSWHVWAQQGEEEEWTPQVAVSGHMGAVRQVMWEPEGEFLLSCAADMSTRLWAPWRRDGLETWHELARPQLHGHPLSSLSFTPHQNRLQFVSGADEKVVRVFDAPGVFLDSLKRIAGVDASPADGKERPMAANVPPLGLSNRAVATADDAAQLAPASSDPFEAIAAVNFEVADHPPLEEQLLGSTLWPETEKLYGPPFELVAVASAHTSPLLATACKATLPEHAVIRLFNTDTWRAVDDVLAGHSLTVTRLAFSPGEDGRRDRWLLSVGRDRTWRVFERDDEKGLGFYRPLADAKAHSRIIWDACWAADASFFATASRDKTVKLWAPSTPSAGEATSFSCTATLKFTEAATSVAATVIADGTNHVLAVGFENGEVRVLTSTSREAEAWAERAVLGPSTAHVLTVSTLSFCPKKDLPTGVLRLASGSEDRSVRVFDIEL
ncbi:Elongator subunit elp2 [Rhodosporidiobolus nylandii]